MPIDDLENDGYPNDWFVPPSSRAAQPNNWTYPADWLAPAPPAPPGTAQPSAINPTPTNPAAALRPDPLAFRRLPLSQVYSVLFRTRRNTAYSTSRSLRQAPSRRLPLRHPAPGKVHLGPRPDCNRSRISPPRPFPILRSKQFPASLTSSPGPRLREIRLVSRRPRRSNCPWWAVSRASARPPSFRPTSARRRSQILSQYLLPIQEALSERLPARTAIYSRGS